MVTIPRARSYSYGGNIQNDRRPAIAHDVNILLQDIILGTLCNDSTIRKVAAGQRETDEVEDDQAESKRDGESSEQEHSTEYEVQGDPTEACIVTLAIHLLGNESDAEQRVREIMRRQRRVAEVPFDSAAKFMATLHECSREAAAELIGGDRLQRLTASEALHSEPIYLAVVKGAPEKICSLIRWPVQHRVHARTAGSLRESEEFWSAQAKKLAQSGMRVLAIAYCILPEEMVAHFTAVLFAEVEQRETDVVQLKMLSLVGIIDPPRPEAIDAIEVAQRAGITVKMITGDHPVTAKAIATMMRIHAVNETNSDSEQRETEESEVITGADLDKILARSRRPGVESEHETTEERVAGDRQCAMEMDATVTRHNIFARTTPEHKLLIVQALQRQGFACCMTGDGVNDAAALSAADIGVAMGLSGTEVAKASALMILTDDNFASIVYAIEIGR